MRVCIQLPRYNGKGGCHKALLVTSGTSLPCVSPRLEECVFTEVTASLSFLGRESNSRYTNQMKKLPVACTESKGPAMCVFDFKDGVTEVKYQPKEKQPVKSTIESFRNGSRSSLSQSGGTDQTAGSSEIQGAPKFPKSVSQLAPIGCSTT